jgi:galactosamine-6-phosphate isomerase
MKITYFDSYPDLSNSAADLLIRELRTKRDAWVCSATGGSPQGLYERLAKEAQQDPSLFDQVRILKLDEWGGIPMSDPYSCHTYLIEKVLKPLNISSDRYEGFDSEADDLKRECKRIQQHINQQPVDVCILGLGKNGHLGFNEPAEFLQLDCHIARLAPTTVQHSMVQAMSRVPSFGMTIGMRGVFNSKKVVLLVTGSGKESVIKRLMAKEVTSQLPASLLWLHPNAECLVDKTSL